MAKVSVVYTTVDSTHRIGPVPHEDRGFFELARVPCVGELIRDEQEGMNMEVFLVVHALEGIPRVYTKHHSEVRGDSAEADLDRLMEHWAKRAGDNNNV